MVEIKGTVNLRPLNDQRDSMNGTLEVDVQELTLLNPCLHPLPLQVHAKKGKAKATMEKKVTMEKRLEYRMLDLRRPTMQSNLRTRSLVVHAMRSTLIEELNFCDIETPLLFKSSPEGAREFVVPTRHSDSHGNIKHYALPQSPQQYKQLLMTAGMDRYFQIARCFRDEDNRADRQPEFTQVDLEMSFVQEPKHIMGVVEQVVLKGWNKAVESLGNKAVESLGNKAVESLGNKAVESLGNKAVESLGNKAVESLGNKAVESLGNKAVESLGNKAVESLGNKAVESLGNKAVESLGNKEVMSCPTGPFERMTFKHAMETYGTDKPDVRLGMEFQPMFKRSGFLVPIPFTNKQALEVVKEGVCVVKTKSDGGTPKMVLPKYMSKEEVEKLKGEIEDGLLEEGIGKVFVVLRGLSMVFNVVVVFILNTMEMTSIQRKQ